MLQFEKGELDVMKKSGQVIGRVSSRYISELYQLDRTRSAEEFIRQLKNICLRAIAIAKNDGESTYTEPIASLVEILNNYKENYDEVKDIVLIYASFYLGAIRASNAQTNK